jgi:hypothetical protein
MQQTCITCKGNLYPYSMEDPHRCQCMPDDYEQCGECGYDHAYEWNDAIAIHIALDRQYERDTIPSPPSIPTLDAFPIPGLPPGYDNVG